MQNLISLDTISKRKEFLLKIQKDFNIQTPSDWGKITSSALWKLGGRSLLNEHDNSLLKLLQQTFTEIEWKPYWFSRMPSGHWDHLQNQRIFLDNLQQKLHINNPSNWGKITTRTFCKYGGQTILKQYNYSMSKMLKAVYPEIKWQIDWFEHVPYGFWKKPDSQRNFFDNLAKKLDVKEPRDWGNISWRKVVENGGRSVFFHIPSLYKALKKVYPEVPWKKEWFYRLKNFDKNHFKSKENQRNFLDTIAIEYSIVKPSEWRRVTASLIKKKGGWALLAQHNFSLANLIRSVYNNVNWDDDFPFVSATSEQLLTMKGVQNLFNK